MAEKRIDQRHQQSRGKEPQDPALGSAFFPEVSMINRPCQQGDPQKHRVGQEHGTTDGACEKEEVDRRVASGKCVVHEPSPPAR